MICNEYKEHGNSYVSATRSFSLNCASVNLVVAILFIAFLQTVAKYMVYQTIKSNK